MTKFISRFVRDNSGATAIEYGLIGAIITLVLVAAVTQVGEGLGAALNSVAEAFEV
jgi:pilus assembly protein Flp/PilA